MEIRKGGSRQFGNFNESELYSKSPDAPESHYFSDAALKGAQAVRDFIDAPAIANSTFRTVAHNKAEGGGSNSQHLPGNAIDLDMDEKSLSKVKRDLRSRGPLFKKLRAIGINGFGIYSGFIHIDARPPAGLQSDEFGPYAYWDKEKGGLDQKKKQ